MKNSKIKVAIVGVGNCASSLVQGLEYYKDRDPNGLMKSVIGDYNISDIEVVVAFDIDERKVNMQLSEAIFAEPNNTIKFVNNIQSEAEVLLVKPMDGVCETTLSHDKGFVVCNEDPLSEDEIMNTLKILEVDMIINYLPVGSQHATEFWADICINTAISFLNCIPVFIASDPYWSSRFYEAGIPIIGDDMKSQFGASILSQALEELAEKRGHKMKAHIQRNIGGNTDFLNMTDTTRVVSKKKSKENVLNNSRYSKNDGAFRHAGPSEYIEYYKDNKIANFRLEMEGFMGSPVEIDIKLSVIDSPNSAGVVIDAIRYLRVARDLGLKGALAGPSAFTQKTPPVFLSIDQAIEECDNLSNGQVKGHLKTNR